MKNELTVIDEREILGKRFRVYGDFENLLFFLILLLSITRVFLFNWQKILG